MERNRSVSKYRCETCDKVFTRAYSLKRHILSLHSGKEIECENCFKTFKCIDNLKSHLCNGASSKNSGAKRPRVDEVLKNQVSKKEVENDVLNKQASTKQDLNKQVERLKKEITVKLDELKKLNKKVEELSCNKVEEVIDLDKTSDEELDDDVFMRNEEEERWRKNFYSPEPKNRSKIDSHEYSENWKKIPGSTPKQRLEKPDDWNLEHEDDYFVEDEIDWTKYEFCHCGAIVDKKDYQEHISSLIHRKNFIGEHFSNVEVEDSAFACNIVRYKIKFNDENIEIGSRLDANVEVVKELLEFELKTQVNVRAQIELNATYVNPLKTTQDVDDTVNFEMKEMNFKTKFSVCDRFFEFHEFFEEQKQKILREEEEFHDKGSGWTIFSINSIVLSIAKYSPLGGGSFLPLPKAIGVKKAIINPQNTDEFCFLYAILMHSHKPQNNRGKVEYYKQFLSELKYHSLTFPLAPRDITKFEKLNSDHSVNVFEPVKKHGTKQYGVDDYRIEVVRITKKLKTNHVNLLLITQGDRQHYCYISNLGKLLNKQFSSNEHKIFVCDCCLGRFSSAERKKLHVESGSCLKREVILPTDKPILKFEKSEHSLPCKFTIYADLECILEKLPEQADQNSKSVRTHLHVPSSFAYKVVSHCETASSDEHLKDVRLYRGENSMQKLIQSLREDVKYIFQNYLTKNEPMALTNEEEAIFQAATHCHICNKKFPQNLTPLSKSRAKVRDHDHISTRFRGAACSLCNLRHQEAHFVPIFFHNLSYDASCFIKELAKYKNDRMSVIPLNKEKYISFSQRFGIINDRGQRKTCEMRFLDSFRFLSSSLSSLANSLTLNDYKYTRKELKEPEKLNLVLRKGVFPYSWLDSKEKFSQCELPLKNAFYNDLTGDHITDLEYEHAQNVFRAFNCRNMGDYSDIYLKTDVLLLCDIFERFRELSLKMFKLDPNHYFTAAGFSWNSMLKFTGIELELITDIEVIEFLKQGIRGGITVCVSKEEIANNIHMRNYDASKPPISIQAFDANNLYAHAMMQSIPFGGFMFTPEAEILETYEKALASNEKDAIGYILEVDIHTPSELHDLHNDHPFLAESKIPPNGKFKKLIADFAPKQKYKIHIRNLKQAIKHGLIVTKVHRILSFNQSEWLRPYIELNNRQRAAALTNFERDYWKLQNNSIFGRSIQCKEKHRNVILSTCWNASGKKNCARKLISRANFHSLSIFDENFVAIEMLPTRVVLNTPIYMGFCILEESKNLMMEFYYSYLKPKFGSRVKLLYSDTDNYIISVQSPDFHAEIKPDITRFFDTSGYSQEMLDKYDFPSVNKKRVGFFKDEADGNTIVHYVGLKAKAYALKIEKENDQENDIKAKLKGVSRAVVKKYRLEPYLNTLYNRTPLISTITRIQSKLHVISTVREQKLALTVFDDKRFQIPNSFETLAWDHYEIPFYEIDETE